MKKLVLLVFALFIAAGSVLAQDKLVDQDYVIMQDNQAVKYTKGMPENVTEAVTLKDGSVVQPDGSYVCSKNKNFQLKEGECLGMSGKKYASEDKLFQKLQAQKKKMLKKAY
jgi:hypothetical protein